MCSCYILYLDAGTCLRVYIQLESPHCPYSLFILVKIKRRFTPSMYLPQLASLTYAASIVCERGKSTLK